MKLVQQPDFEHNEAENSGKSTVLVDGVPYVVIDYYDKHSPVNYQVLKDGNEVEPTLAREIFKAYNADLESFIDDVINSPPLRVVED